VHQPFDIDVDTGPAVCYGDSSFVEIITPTSDYAVYWQLDSIIESNYLEGKPGIYEAEVIELFSGCSQTYDINIPGPPPLSANFTIIPNQPCIDIIDNTVQIIDLSTGYTDGWIDFGDSSPLVPYVLGELITHDYTAIGDYTITLLVTNDLGCEDTLRRDICVENVVKVYMPNVFSPNGDGANDLFKIEAYGVGEFTWSVYSRWGDLVFAADSVDDQWDGSFDGQSLDPGVFVVRLIYKDFVTGEKTEEVKGVTLIK
jgi:gliding motility-associated-like protein